MVMASIEEIRATFEPMFLRLEDKIESIEAHHAEAIERLREQSSEHYVAERDIERAITERFETVRQQCAESAERQGTRMGIAEGQLTANQVKIEDLDAAIKSITSGSRWGKQMWIIVGVAAASPFLARLIELF